MESDLLAIVFKLRTRGTLKALAIAAKHRTMATIRRFIFSALANEKVTERDRKGRAEVQMHYKYIGNSLCVFFAKTFMPLPSFRKTKPNRPKD